jgi:glutamate synthase domain-containing protein 3
MKKKKDGLKINLVQKKPHKVYKTEIEYDFQIDDLCKFLRQNKDRIVSIVINGKHTKFNSFAGKKRFAAGFNQGSDFVLGYTKQLFERMQEEISGLKNELISTADKLAKQREKNNDIIGKLRTKEVVTELRREAYLDHVNEINEDRELLKERLKKVEPVIKLVVKATTDGQLQKAYKLAKKLKL